MVLAMLATRSLPRAASWPWLLIATSAVVASALQLQLLVGAGNGATMHMLVRATYMCLFALAVFWILHRRDDRGLEIALDAGMILAAITVAMLRWTPAAQALLRGAEPASFLALVGTVAVPGAAVTAILFALVLVVDRGGSRAATSAAALAVAAVAFGVGAAAVALGTSDCCSRTDPAAVVSVAGWLAVAWAALRAIRMGAVSFENPSALAGGTHLRMVVPPAVAVVMGAAVIDSAWRGPFENPTALAVGFLAVLLALRISQLLFATRSQSAERLALSQSRAMIEVSQALSGTTRLDETLDLVTEWAVKLLNGRAAAIELLTPDGQSLEFHAVHGLPPEVLHLKVPVDGSFTGWVVLNAKSRYTADPHSDPFVHSSSREYLGNSPLAAAPLSYRNVPLGAISCIGRAPFNEADVALLGAFADQAAVAIENARLFQQVHQLSLTDPLTGLANRRQLEKDLLREFAAARRGRQLVAIMFDLNGFKDFNDKHGHLAGDNALRVFGDALTAETRAMNMAFRYGGDEFLVLLADADLQGAEIFIERVRHRFPGADADEIRRSLSVAAGYAEFVQTMRSPDDLVVAADRALYQDKSEAHQRLSR